MNSKSPTPDTPLRRTGANFRKRYDEIERRRSELVGRLSSLDEKARGHPGYRRAQKLLNDIFRKSSLAQRLGVLQAANWLIDILEKLNLTS